MDTSSSATEAPIEEEEESPTTSLDDLDLKTPNPIYTEVVDDTNSSDETNSTDETGSTDSTDSTEDKDSTGDTGDGGISIFDTVDAVEDIHACMLGDSTSGYTNKVLKDGSIDAQSTLDSEHGVGANSRFSYDSDVSKTEVAVFYNALKPVRTYKMVSIYEDLFRVDFDKSWIDNDVTIVYVRTPKDKNDLFKCYRYDLKGLDVLGSTISTKVYRKEL